MFPIRRRRRICSRSCRRRRGDRKVLSWRASTTTHFDGSGAATLPTKLSHGLCGCRRPSTWPSVPSVWPRGHDSPLHASTPRASFVCAGSVCVCSPLSFLFVFRCCSSKVRRPSSSFIASFWCGRMFGIALFSSRFYAESSTPIYLASRVRPKRALTFARALGSQWGDLRGGD